MTKSTYRVAAIFPDHFQSFTVSLKNQLVSEFFCAKLSRLSVEAETKTNRHIPARINQQEATRTVIVSRLRAGLTVEEIMSIKTSKGALLKS
jgi:uracil phosphoribosyltransferase